MAASDTPTKAAAPSSQGGTDRAPGASGKGNDGPPVAVTTVRAQQKDMPVKLSASGTVSSLASVDVKAQVSSVVTQVHIQDGQFVKAGQLLFTLDTRSDEANVAKARAQWAKDNATLQDARRQLTRSKELLAQSFISQGGVDTAQAQVDAQQALVNADLAAVDAARVPLSNGRIVAPSAGRAGAVAVSPGSVVVANQTLLVNITQLDPIAVSYSIAQRSLGDALGALKDGGQPVTASLSDGGVSLQGRLKFVDNAVEASSGSVKVKAVFANPEGKLWPGAFVNVAQTVSLLKNAVVVPQASVIQTARGTMVYIVESGKAVSRPVKVLLAQNGDAAVEGIQAGDPVVLDGRQNLKPGTRVMERAPGAAGAGGGAGDAGTGQASGQGGGKRKKSQEAAASAAP